MKYFFTKTKVICGPGSLRELSTALRSTKSRNPLVVTDPGLAKSGTLDKLLKEIGSVEGVEAFTDVFEDPTVGLIDSVAEKLVQKKCDSVIGLGGGSSLDVAKGAAVVAANGGSSRDYIGDDLFDRPPLPVIAVPTTAGTGAEVSWHIAVKDEIKEEKTRIRSPLATAHTAILDPELLITLPQKLAAACGIDAFTHVYESYISTQGAWELTDCLALEAVRLIATSLRQFVADPANLRTGEKMLIASMFGGICLSHAITGVVHAMAKPVGARFGVHHGLANAVSLPHAAEFSRNANPAKFKELARAMGENVAHIDEDQAGIIAVKAMGKLCRDIGIPERLSQVGVTRESLPQLAKDAVGGKDFLSNPRRFLKEEILAIYEKAF